MKFKQIPKDYFLTILDRLNRFEPACYRYKRVFDDIINKFSLSVSLKDLSLDDEISFVEEIFNSSLSFDVDCELLTKRLLKLEKFYFSYNEISDKFITSNINIASMMEEISLEDNLPQNLVWLREIYKTDDFLFDIRNKKSLLYPIERIILCEGETENALLKTLFKIFKVDLDKLGVLVLAAGGKNQVARKFYSMLEYTKIPFFILLDKDAKSIQELIEPKMRDIDNIYLFESGEFEDIIPKKVLIDAINSIHENELNCTLDDFDNSLSMVLNLENIYKKYGFGEFKKAHFALSLKEYIENNCTSDDFQDSEFKKFVELFLDFKQKTGFLSELLTL